MLRLIICGSPRTNGRSASLSNTLFEGCIAEFPNDEVKLVPISQINVAGCTGCGSCNGDTTSESVAEETAIDPSAAKENKSAQDSAEASTETPAPPRCVIKDDMTYVYENIEAADEIILVSPVYFSGAPSQLKALMDRLQPYYMQSAAAREKAAAAGKTFKTAVKPLTLHVVGEGKSPYGYDALVNTVSAAFAVAGFKLDAIADWVGKISPTGTITTEPQMYALATGEPEAPPTSHA